MKINFVLLIFFFASSGSYSQTCLNLPAINGSLSFAVAPVGYSMTPIPNSSPDIILGNGVYGSGYVISDVSGPSLAGGAMSLMLNNSNAIGEGLQTTLSGLTIGTVYSIPVAWQQMTLSSSFTSYGGGQLQLQIVGQLPQLYSSSGGLNDGWQTAVYIFTATSTSHVFEISKPIESFNGGIVVDNFVCISSLPIELINFNTSLVDNNYVKVTWDTFYTPDVDYYMLEESIDLILWTSVCKNYKSDLIDEIAHYNYDDFLINSNFEKKYYKLSKVDYNGEKTMLSIGNVFMEFKEIKIFPNPVRENLNIQGLRGDNPEINIFRSDGSVQATEVLENEQKNYSINTKSWRSGIYFIVLKTDSQEIRQKIVVEK